VVDLTLTRPLNKGQGYSFFGTNRFLIYDCQFSPNTQNPYENNTHRNTLSEIYLKTVSTPNVVSKGGQEILLKKLKNNPN